jgi:hypothetical protein
MAEISILLKKETIFRYGRCRKNLNDTVRLLVELVGFFLSDFYLLYREALLGVLIDQIRKQLRIIFPKQNQFQELQSWFFAGDFFFEIK